MLWGLSGLEVFGYYGFGTLAPPALVAKGYNIVHSLGFTAITYLGYPIGSLLSVPLIERGERKVIVIARADRCISPGRQKSAGSASKCPVTWTCLSTIVEIEDPCVGLQDQAQRF